MSVLPTDNTKIPGRSSLLKTSLTAYVIMAFVSFEIGWWFQPDFRALFSLNGPWYSVLLIVLTSLTFLMLSQLTLEQFFPSYSELRKSIAQMLVHLKWPDVFLLALFSAAGEELLFRGVLQPYLGIWFSSAIFALLHVNPNGRYSVWALWSFMASVILGYSLQVTNSLWTPILIHFFVNIIGLARVYLMNQTHTRNPVKSDPSTESK